MSPKDVLSGFDEALTKYVDERVDAMGSYRCTRCGGEHVAFEVGFAWPDYAVVNGMATGEEPDEDTVVLDGHTFIRGVVYVPIRGSKEALGVGIWLELEDSEHGRIANQLGLLGPLLGAQAKVVAGAPGYRPGFRLVDHPLARAQDDGLDAETVDRWRSNEAHRGEPEPIGAPFTATLGEYGWELLTAATLGKQPCTEDLAPGDHAKIAVRFETIGDGGGVRQLVAGWWLLVDHVAELVSGTLHSEPKVPATLATGTRIWARRDQLLERQRT